MPDAVGVLGTEAVRTLAGLISITGDIYTTALYCFVPRGTSV